MLVGGEVESSGDQSLDHTRPESLVQRPYTFIGDYLPCTVDEAMIAA